MARVYKIQRLLQFDGFVTEDGDLVGDSATHRQSMEILKKVG